MLTLKQLNIHEIKICIDLFEMWLHLLLTTLVKRKMRYPNQTHRQHKVCMPRLP